MWYLMSGKSIFVLLVSNHSSYLYVKNNCCTCKGCVHTQDMFVDWGKKNYVGTSYLYDPWAVGKCHDVTFLPEEGRIWAFDHFKLTEHLHCIYLLRGLMPNLQKHITTNPHHIPFVRLNSLLKHSQTTFSISCASLPKRFKNNISEHSMRGCFAFNTDMATF